MNVNYDVGQIVFLFNSKNLTIVPALVVEEILRKTVSSTEVQYVLQFPDKKKTRVLTKDIDHMIFKNIDALRAHMLENATKTIDRLVKTADDQKHSFFNDALNQSTDSEVSDTLEFMQEKNNTYTKDKNFVQNEKKDSIIKDEEQQKEVKKEETDNESTISWCIQSDISRKFRLY